MVTWPVAAGDFGYFGCCFEFVITVCLIVFYVVFALDWRFSCLLGFVGWC